MRRNRTSGIVHDFFGEEFGVYAQIIDRSASPMPNRWQTDGLGLIPTINATDQLQKQLNGWFGAIQADLAALKDRA